VARPETGPLGVTPPLGQSQFPPGAEAGQEPLGPARHFRCRRCLLKGCEQRFRPTHPQSRYCSDACRRHARRWRRCRASRSWRASELGKDRRREQCRRYRRRIPLVVLPESYFATGSVKPEVPAVATSSEAPQTREGQRPASKSDDFSVRPCERPGCYVWFAVASAWSPQRFCSSGCRRALRNVLDREARYRRRRREGYRPPRRRSQPAPPRPP